MMIGIWAIAAALIVGQCSGTCHTSENDCLITYGEWSDCDPCLLTQSRHLNITTPPQFDGLPCPADLVQVQACTTRTVCPADLPCPGQFNCQNAGRCVNDSLICNGDDDCGNNADEKSCASNQQFARSMEECLNLDPIPYLDQIGSGVDFTSGKLVGRVVDNQRYQGLCRKAASGNLAKTFRMPYNVNNFHFQVKSSDQLETKAFHSLADYSNEKDTTNTNSWSESVSVGGSYDLFSGKVSESMSYSHTDTFKQIYTSMKDKRANIFSISATLEVGQFIMKDDDLLLDSYFENSLHKLPAKLNHKSYFNFFDQYGAFYLHSGVLGGRYEHDYIFTDDDMQNTQQTTTSLSQCLKFSMSASLGFGSFISASGSGGFDKCKDAHGNVQSSSDVANSATNKVVSIVGGTAEAAGKLVGAALASNGTFQQSKFEAWALGVQQNPALLSQTYRPVCDLFLSSKTADAESKFETCMAAVKAYVQPLNPTTCMTCKNGGKALNIDGQCQCACLRGFKGQACAEQDIGGIVYQVPRARGRFQYNREELVETSLSSEQDIKFLVSGNPPVASNPPYLHKYDVGQYDGILKTKEDKVYYLHSTTGQFYNNRGFFTGAYSIVQLSEYLEPLATVTVDFSTIPECGGASITAFCHVRDYDIDMHGFFVISVRITDTKANSYTNVYKVDGQGKRNLTISQPCLSQGESNGNVQIYVSTTCEDSILVSCPGLSPATVKLFSSQGHPQGLNQFSTFESITGVQYFNGAVWIHTKSNQVAAYDIMTWDQVFNYTTAVSETGDATPYSQLFVDFAGNLLIAQAYDNTHSYGMSNYKVSIIDTTTKRPLALVTLAAWNSCTEIATYRGKLYTLCYNAQNSQSRSVLVFDYLK